MVWDVEDISGIKEIQVFNQQENERGRIEAPEGGHDDQMMGLAIAHHIREQVVFDNEVIEVQPQRNFNIEKMMEVHNEYGDYITVI